MKRETGIVVPLSALYTKECPDVGDFLALKPFAEFCKKCNLTIIQLLPVNDTGTQSSPYSGLSAFALHPLYIRLEDLPEFQEIIAEDSTFAEEYTKYKKDFTYSRRFDYDAVLCRKTELLRKVYTFIEKKNDSTIRTAMEAFVKANEWIIPYAVYKNFKDDHLQASWKEWEKSLQEYTIDDINTIWNTPELSSKLYFFVWSQMRAAEQFKSAADYVKSLGITIKGDIPILMNEDSADAWAYKDYFNHTMRAGSPPDGENPMGQNWGFPTYKWDKIAKADYSWWKSRIKTASDYYSAFRIDHILGFFRIWAVNENDTTAYLGYTLPCHSFTAKKLNEIGFDNDRIKWLSVPHIPTNIIEDITWNHDEAVNILSKVCDRIGNEELWNFNKKIKGDKLIYQLHFSDDADKDNRIKDALARKWRDRCLIETSKNHFVPVWKYYESTSWNTLNQDEKNKLQTLFTEKDQAENKLWKKQALNALTPITKETNMIPCAEDLGVNLESMPEVLKKLSILSLKVLRWSRKWSENDQPYYSLKDFPSLSVCTTSVHDSPTLRQWWNNEKDSVRKYLEMCSYEQTSDMEGVNPDDCFNPHIAYKMLVSAARTNSQWFINPLQDYLYMDEKFYSENPDDERINVPGTVNGFNWTWRIPAMIDELTANENLARNIKEISNIHNN